MEVAVKVDEGEHGSGSEQVGARARRLMVRGAVLRLAVTICVLVAVFSVLGRLVAGPYSAEVTGMDYRVAVWVRSHRSPFMGWFMWWVSEVGETIPMAIASTLGFAYLLCRRKWHRASLVGPAMAGTGIMWGATVLLVHRTRPDWWLVHNPSDLGYPSGHVMNAVVLGGILAAIWWSRAPSPRLRWAGVVAATLFALSTAVSRIYINAHFATDITAGLLMGAAWLWVAVRVHGEALGPATAALEVPRGP